MKPVLAVLPAMLALACSSPPPAPPATEPPAPSMSSPAEAPGVEMAPTPYTAEQIRDATRVGRTYEFLVERPDGPPVRRRVVFVGATQEKARVESSMIDDKGKPVGEPEQKDASWEELRQHASWPKSATTIEPATATTPAGTFSCLKYTVVEKKDGKSLATIACFAKDLPGPPVEMRKEVDGTMVMTMVLLRHEPGR